MKILQARVMGMCFGVKDALEVVTALDSPRGVAVYGQLVHNPEVCSRLEKLGIHCIEEKEKISRAAHHGEARKPDFKGCHHGPRHQRSGTPCS